MAKMFFIVVVTLAIIVNLLGWIMEKVYKKKMTKLANEAKQKEFDNINGNS